MLSIFWGRINHSTGVMKHGSSEWHVSKYIMLQVLNLQRDLGETAIFSPKCSQLVVG